MSASQPAQILERPRVVLVTAGMTVAPSAAIEAVIAQLRGDAIAVELRQVDVLDGPPAAPVYVVSTSAATCAPLAARFVAWAAARDPRAGLIGIVDGEDRADACELVLAAGFDDVMPAPASPRELVARVRAVHRRVYWKGTSHGRLRFGEITLDPYERALWTGGKTISLTSIELAVLRELIKARGKPLSRGELLDAAWGEADLEVSERAVDNVILRLRRKLPRPELIETVRSVGFRLAPRMP